MVWFSFVSADSYTLYYDSTFSRYMYQMTSQVGNEDLISPLLFFLLSFFFCLLALQALQLKISVCSPAFMLAPNPLFLCKNAAHGPHVFLLIGHFTCGTISRAYSLLWYIYTVVTMAFDIDTMNLGAYF